MPRNSSKIGVGSKAGALKGGSVTTTYFHVKGHKLAWNPLWIQALRYPMRDNETWRDCISELTRLTVAESLCETSQGVFALGYSLMNAITSLGVVWIEMGAKYPCHRLQEQHSL